MKTAENVVLITGGASGLGAALARSFSLKRHAIVILDQSQDALESLRQSLGDDRVVFVEGNVTNYCDNERAVRIALERFGRLDTVIANAGIWDFNRRLDQLDPATIDESFDQIFHVNVKGHLLLARAASESLRESEGSIIFTLSTASLYPGTGGPLYTASKHAGVGMTKELAHELAPHIRVNAVAPSAMRTSLTGPASLGLEKARVTDVLDAEKFAARAPLGFLPDPEDYTSAYHFLADPVAARTVTGVILPMELGMGVRGTN